MPMYEFLNENTGLVEDHLVKMSELFNFTQDNPHLSKTVRTAPAIGDSVRLGIKKNDAGWREVLQRVAHLTPGADALRDSIR